MTQPSGKISIGETMSTEAIDSLEVAWALYRGKFPLDRRAGLLPLCKESAQTVSHEATNGNLRPYRAVAEARRLAEVQLRGLAEAVERVNQQ